MAEEGSSTRARRRRSPAVFDPGAPGLRPKGAGSDEAAIVKKPAAVYVEKVYDEGDFSALGIGT